MPDDVRQMHERLVVASRGDGSLSQLRIEVFEGSLAAHRNVNIENGKLVSKEWSSPGAPMVQREGSVADSRVSELLTQLIEARYWTLEGTRFVPDRHGAKRASRQKMRAGDQLLVRARRI